MFYVGASLVIVQIVTINNWNILLHPGVEMHLGVCLASLRFRDVLRFLEWLLRFRRIIPVSINDNLRSYLRIRAFIQWEMARNGIVTVGGCTNIF